jgi:hypothetical protein
MNNRDTVQVMSRTISNLPFSVRAKADVQDNGEVVWPLEDALDAINALADSGQVILGLDFWEYDENQRILEMPWNAYEPEGKSTDVESGRRTALEEFARAVEVLSLTSQNWVLITW